MRLRAKPIYIMLITAIVIIANTKCLFSMEADPIQFTVTVYDSSTSSPIINASVTIISANNDAEREITDSKGQAIFRLKYSGTYKIEVFYTGYSLVNKSIDISGESNSAAFYISPISYTTEEIEIVGEKESTTQSEISTVTGSQVYNADATHEPPTSRMANIIHDNLTGAVPAPTGEVHIRGMHGEFTYVIDGVPINPGIFGGLNEIIDPQIISKIKFITGGFTSEYGGQLAAILDIESRIPPGTFHMDFSSYAGSYLVFNGTSPFKKGNDVPTGLSSGVPGDTLGGKVGPLRSMNQNGEALSFSGHQNKLGYFFSSSREETDRRIDQPVPTLYNDHGIDYSLYGKLDFVINKNDYLSANLSYAKTVTQVPFDINTQGYSPDSQTGSNSFQTVSYTHLIPGSKGKAGKFFIGFIARQGSLNFSPSPLSPVTFPFAGDSTLYALTIDRKFQSYGLNTKYDYKFSKTVSAFTGANFSATTGTADFTSRDSLGNPGPIEHDKVKGSDFGLFAGVHALFYSHFGLDIGLRYDQHIAPEADMQKQLSPRVKLSFLIDKNTNGYIYYGRLFMPTNIEAVKSLASNVTTTGSATLPEKDDFYEATLMHKFTFGLMTKAAVFYKHSSPGLDDQSIGSSAVKTPVNIENVKTTGIELSLSYQHPKIPISAFLNTAIIHAYGSGSITGGFLPIDNAGNATDLDHDQRLTITSGINYQPEKWFVEVTENYGSGLTNGNPDNISYQTGLFDFNSAAHVTPWIIFNIGAGYNFKFKNGVMLKPSLYINNLFDKAYLLKGAFFSGASYGERRNVILKLEAHI